MLFPNNYHNSKDFDSSLDIYDEGPQKQGARVFYYGKLTYFHGDHLRYAIPAAFALVLMTIMPPILLLSYPLCYKILSFFRLGESNSPNSFAG